MRRVVELVEYESRELELDEQTARDLRAAARDALAITVTGEPGRYLVTAKQLVGSIVLDEIEILIRPKIRPENLFLLLEVGLPAEAWRRETFDYATNHDLLPAVVSFFARTLDTTLARGVLRSYREHRERLIALRGPIDHPEQLRQPAIASPMACVFDDFTADVLENWYLRAAVQRVMRVAGVRGDVRQTLRRNLAPLEGVSDTPVRPEHLDEIVVTRLNQHYEPALRLARLLLANLTLLDRSGSTGASAFLVDMNDLYQRFVFERLRRLLRPEIQVIEEPREYLGAGRQVPMRPDLVFLRDKQPVYVGDAKYKLTGDATARSGDYYQLLAYTTAMQLDEGVLVYCLADGGMPEREVRVRHTDTSLWTYCVDLTGSADEVDASVTALATWIRSRPSAEPVLQPIAG